MLAVLEAMGNGARAGEGGPVSARAPSGGTAVAVVDGSGVRVRVACGDALDPVVLRSYCTGAALMALGWVRSEGLAVDEDITLAKQGRGIQVGFDPALEVFSGRQHPCL